MRIRLRLGLELGTPQKQVRTFFKSVAGERQKGGNVLKRELTQKLVCVRWIHVQITPWQL